MKQHRKSLLCAVAVLAAMLQTQPISTFALDPVTTPDDGTCGQYARWHFVRGTNELVIEGTGKIERDEYEMHSFTLETDVEVIRISEGIESIDDDAFKDCQALKTVSLPDTFVSIGARAFENCRLLESIQIPENVTEIGADSFAQCYSLKTAEFSGPIQTLEDRMFKDCSSLETVTLPDTITKIGTEAFSGCMMLHELELPSQLTEIGDSAFQSCSRLETLVFPIGITELRANVIAGCTGLQELTFMNPDCVMPTEHSAITCKVRGYANSTAAAYARQNRLNFERILERGDIDGNGEIDVADAQAVLMSYVAESVGKKPTLNQRQLEAADVNFNCKTDAVDANIILEYYLYNGIMDEPTAWESLYNS